MRMWVDGAGVDSVSGQVMAVTDPATGEVLDTAPAGAPDDVEKAAAKMRQHFDELVRLLTLGEGKPLPENEEEVDWSINTLDYYAELGRHARGRVIPSPEAGQLSLVLKEPYGVVACIVPWNYPILLLIWKVAPALAAGNTVVVKPASLTPLTTLRMVQVAFEHLPPGVINVVTGQGGVVGDALVAHAGVPVVAFTGSTAVGRHIARLTAGQMKKLHLELGGKEIRSSWLTMRRWRRRWRRLLMLL